MPKVRVSIVIPTYNRAAMLVRAIDSVIAQTFQDWELWVIDDGSEDPTAEVVRRYQDARIHYYRHHKNQGAAAARNTGIKMATAPLIAFLDSDDAWLPEKLARQVKLLENAPFDICCTGFEWHVKGMCKSYVPKVENFYHAMVQGCAISPGSTLMVRRSVLERVGVFDTSLRRFEDWDWLLRYAASGGQCGVVPEICARIYTTRGPESTALVASVPVFIERHYASFVAAGKIGRHGLAQLWLQGAGAARRAHLWKTMLRYLWQAHRHWPGVLCHYLWRNR